MQDTKKPSQVNLYGTVTTTGANTRPEKITFTSLTTGHTYVVATIGEGNPADYTIYNIPNGDSYSVTITYVNTIWGSLFGGDANAGTLDLNTFQSSIRIDWSG
jgi:hypothetical protein